MHKKTAPVLTRPSHQIRHMAAIRVAAVPAAIRVEVLVAVVTVAAGCSIEFLKPAHLDDVLTCEGVEQVLQGRHGIYDMKVTNQRGEVVAMFRGKSASIQGHVIPVEEA